MPRLLPISKCSKKRDSCVKPDIIFNNNYLEPLLSKKVLQSTIIQSQQRKRLGCAISGLGISNGSSSGSTSKCGKTTTTLRKINNYGRYNSGTLSNPMKGGLPVSNF